MMKEAAIEALDEKWARSDNTARFTDMLSEAYDIGYESARSSWTAEILKMAKALDAIYNHNEAARAAVIQYYGLHHGEIVRELLHHQRGE